VGGAKAGEAAGLPITAPISGVVTERAATQGQTVDTMTDMLTIVATDRVWVVGNAYEKDLSRVRKGQKAIVRVTGLDGKSFTGTVTHVSTVLDTATRTAKVRCEVQNPGGQLRPGMFANVDLVSEARGSAILIPKAAVMDDAGKNIVFVACMECEEDKVAGTNACGAYDKMEVQVGPVRDERIEILGGLTPGMEVVTTGQFQLKTALGSGQLKAGCTDH
jgi:RND family efflux transporter MFP subunit